MKGREEVLSALSSEKAEDGMPDTTHGWKTLEGDRGTRAAARKDWECEER